ncbi:hypothetical protein DAPK24_013470 [Pichia kluyveri]|uniref:Telomere-length maintenance and DNA damage repair domain-containing protein n=1 Tax=Pichia kluyveri TaxID=36015 RepID=A0AAV5R141_PICKL|nr:hypothetical protein DAPK24_013470 [Pichia kluyveri]
MVRNSLDSICELLLSSKIRDRTEAIQKLENFNFSLSSTINLFDNESLLKLLNSLDYYIETDRSIYEKSNNNTSVEIRLNKASSITKSLITSIYCNKTFINLYKPRQSEKLINSLLKNLTYTPANSDFNVFEIICSRIQSNQF